MNIKNLLYSGLKFAKNNSGTIGSILAVGGVIGCCILSSRAGKYIAENVSDDLEPKEKLKEYAKAYVPTGLCAGATIASILASNHSHIRKEAALAGLAALWKTNYKELDGEVTEKLGAEETSNIHKDIIKKRIKENPPMQMPLPTGMILVYEPYTKQYIETTREKLAWALLETNKKLMKDFDVRLGFLINLLGGTTVGHPEANEIGWNWENEAQEYLWSYYGGPWIDILTEIPPGKNNLFQLGTL